MNALRHDVVAKALSVLACAAVLIGITLASVPALGMAGSDGLVAQSSNNGPLATGWIVLIVIGALLVLILFGIIIAFFKIWIRALASGARVSFGTLIGMRLRKVSAGLIVDARIMCVKAGLSVSTNDLETHFLAGGNVLLVVRALIAADKANIPLSFQKAAAIDLAGRDVFQAVQISVKPEVIDAPDPSKGPDKVGAVAKDGIQLWAKAKVTVRANIERLVGGAWTETVIARVGEGIVTTIGSAESHKAVLENPDMISKKVLEKGLDSGTAFEILSIDIADIDVGENIGARLQTDQAEADKRVAQAKAEGRRAMAVAQEQENLARIQEMRARVVEAEAQVPLAIAQAFREGNLGIMDYYGIKNIQADTSMRESIGGRPTEQKKPDQT
ncbi:MAG TPA: flotillin-like protein FloA [Vicinamibacterales bacterium]|nr:flotillin-like protein FloA [Vicinamibacterales bacterium]